MAYVITDECVACGTCAEACPAEAISEGDILRMDPEMAGVLVAGGMHCIGCPSAQMETIEEAALVHGIEPDLLVARVNAFVESKQA